MKNLKKKIFGLVTTNKDLIKLFNQQKDLYTYIINKHNFFYIVDLSNFLIFKNYKKNKNIILPPNVIYFKPKNYYEFKKFLGENKFIAFNNLGKNLNYLYIYSLIKSLKIRLILLFNLGHIGNSLISNESFKSKILYIKNKSFELLYKIFIFFKILPQIDLYFHTDSKLVNKINYINKRRSRFFFNSYFNFTYIKKSSLVSLRKNNFKKKRKYIIFIDSNFYHSDRLTREGNPNIFEEKNYFNNLKNFLNLVSKKFKKKIYICIHPSSNIKIYKKYFLKIKIKQNMSHRMIAEGFLIFAHDSSLIVDSMNLSKPLVILKSNHLGDYIQIRCINYINMYKLKNINIDLKKKYLMNEVNKLKISNLITKKKKIKIVSNNQIMKQLENVI